MLLRISLIVAILAAIAVGVLNFVMVKEKIETVEAHRAKEETDKKTAQTALSAKTKEWEKSEAKLKQTEETLATTTADLTKSQAEVASLSKKTTDLTDKLATATKDLADARAELASYVATGFKSEQIVNFGKQLKTLQDNLDGATVENKILDRKLKQAKAALAKYEDPGWKPPILPVGLKGKVLVTDPKWDFVVLDVGTNQDVVLNGEMLVTRNGKLVAKVSIRTVEANRCIANILPDWKLGEVLEGDTVISVQPPS